MPKQTFNPFAGNGKAVPSRPEKPKGKAGFDLAALKAAKATKGWQKRVALKPSFNPAKARGR